jgi:hypothetical protein
MSQGSPAYAEASARQGGRGLRNRKERAIASLVLLAAQALAQRVVPLTRNSFKTSVPFTPRALPHGSPGLWRRRLDCGPGRARVVYSARLHSRGIDSVGGVRPLVPVMGESPGSLPEGRGARGGSRCTLPHRPPGLSREACPLVPKSFAPAGLFLGTLDHS